MVAYLSTRSMRKVIEVITPYRPSPMRTALNRSVCSVRLHTWTLPSQSTSSSETTLSTNSPCRCPAGLIPPTEAKPATVMWLWSPMTGSP